MVSAISSRARRHRPAPSDSRIAASRTRALARLEIRLATLPQATARTITANRPRSAMMLGVSGSSSTRDCNSVRTAPSTLRLVAGCERLEAAEDGLGLAAGRGAADTRAEPPFHDVETLLPIGQRLDGRQTKRPLHGHRKEQRWAEMEVHADERLRRHADDLKIAPVEADLPADHQRVPSEVRHPGLVREQHDGVAAGDLPLAPVEPAAQLRRHAHRLEKVGADGERGPQLRLSLRILRKADGDGVKRGHRLERAIPAAEVLIFRIRET